jgi:hypothetical protein
MMRFLVSSRINEWQSADGPSTMRSTSPVVSPYEPPRLESPWDKYRYARTCSLSSLI